MTDPQVFYNREDLWVPPLEKYEGKVGPMEPYYILMKLPGSDQLEYLIIMRLYAAKPYNTISWVAARSTSPITGKCCSTSFPRKLIYGPSQVSAMIDQNTTISQQLTLWDQRGLSVIRGQLVVIPIENSFLYVVPLYLKAEGGIFPYERVIAATGNTVVMEPTLDEALSALFASPGTAVRPNGPAPPVSSTELEQARTQLAEVQKALDALEAAAEKPAASPPAARSAQVAIGSSFADSS